MINNHHHLTPHLTTALSGPLHLIEKQLLSREKDIEQWFQTQWQKSRAPVYGSIDLRNAGFKLAPIDMNLFPAGFNNLNPDFLPLAIEAARVAINEVNNQTKNILLIPENHTRNVFYWENIKALLTILEGAGFNVVVGSLLQDPPETITLSNGTVIFLHKVSREGDVIRANQLTPDVVLLNNDLSDGIPGILQKISQPLLPPPELGWSCRSKTNHFQHYADVTEEFSKLIDIDPWFITPLFRHCGEVDFMLRSGETCLSENAMQLFAEIEKKYKEYQISCKPYIVVKADAGTYGIAVMTVRSVDEIKLLNRKQRTSMAKSKGGKPVHSVIMQEGVYTFETWGKANAVAEPVVYLWGQRVVGGFYRVHKDRGVDENLNTPGMHFEPLAFSNTCTIPGKHLEQDECQNRFYAYGVVARLSMVAAAREMLNL